MGFWTEQGTNLGRDPKRGFRFIVQVTNIGGGASSDATSGGGIMWYAKTVDKPSFEISTTEHNYLNHKFNYPGRTSWSPVALKVVDPTSPDMAATFSDIITAAGYHPPVDANDHTSMQKALATTAANGATAARSAGAHPHEETEKEKAKAKARKEKAAEKATKAGGARTVTRTITAMQRPW